MAAKEDELGALHEKVAQVLSKALDGETIEIRDDEGEIEETRIIPPSAALITATIQFLKNNAVTAAPSKDNAMGELERKVAERASKRAQRLVPTEEELASANEQAAFLRGLN